VDPFDSFIEVSAQRKSKIRTFIRTFTKSVDECKNEYKTDYLGAIIDWEKEHKDVVKSLSDNKNVILKEPKENNVFLFRE
jgi:hypothetical protein